MPRIALLALPLLVCLPVMAAAAPRLTCRF
jgi:hypothetical protein